MVRKPFPASFLILLCALSACAEQPPQPGILTTGSPASIGLINQPFPYAALAPPLTPAQIAALPTLPDPKDEIPRREHAYISTALAEELGFLPYNPKGLVKLSANWQLPHPQIRVRLSSPETLSNWQSGNTFRDRSSNALFTIVGVIDDARSIVWVYGGFDGNNVEDDSGQYKLFAEDTVNLGNRVRQIKTFADADADGLLDSVAARVFRPASRSTLTVGNSPNTTISYAENDGFNGSYNEAAVRKNDPRFVLLVPHGGDIEIKTSDQIPPFVTTLQGAPYNVPVNSWKTEGEWGDDQTLKRWHITATSLSETSFSALKSLLQQAPFSPTHHFRRALALHGFSANEADIVIGGNTALNAKCHVSKKIKAEAGMGPVAVRIHHNGQIIDVAANDNHKVCRKGLDGGSGHNIVNRLAADGGIQIEQSGDVRGSSTFRNGVANGAAKAVGELLNGTAPANACLGYAAPVNENQIPSC